jgi:hypothetical protein
MLKKVLKDPFGAIIVSVILGLGLAAVFRRACNGNDCVVVRAPNAKELDKYVYQIDQACYKYTPRVVQCDAAKADAEAAKAAADGTA